jgi:hypothetical protein
VASDQTLRAIITVLDKTAEPIAQINARFRAMSLPLREISSRIGELAEQTGIRAIGEHAGHALEQVRHLGEGLMEIAGPLAALGAAGSLAGLVEIAKGAAEFAEKLDIGAAMTGIATEQLAGWHYAAGLVNIDVDRLDRGFTFLNRTIAEAAAGKAKDVQSILTHMGFHNTPGHLVTTADALKAVAAEAKHLVDSGQIELATNMMAKLFGARSGAQLLPLFGQGPEELTKTLAGAQEAGISLTAAQTAGGHAFMEQYKGMSASVEGLKIAIGNELFPVLTPAIEATRHWLNDPHTRLWITEEVGELVKVVRQIEWKRIGHDIEGIAKSVKRVVDEIGGIGPALGIVATISFAPTIMEFGRLAWAVTGVSTELLLFPAASFVATLGQLVPAIGGVRDAWVALDLAMSANPLGAAIAAATLLGAAAYEVWEHWDWLSGAFEKLWDDIAAIFEAGWEEIKPIVEGLRDALSLAASKVGLGTGPVTDAAVNAAAAKAAAMLPTVDPFGDYASDVPGYAAPAASRSSPATRTSPVPPGRLPTDAARPLGPQSFLLAAPPAFGTQPLPQPAPAAPATFGTQPLSPAPPARFGAEPLQPPAPPARFGTQPSLPSLPGAAAAVGGATPAPATQGGENKLTVEFKNTPPGTTVRSDSRGDAPVPDVNVGYAWGF